MSTRSTNVPCASDSTQTPARRRPAENPAAPRDQERNTNMTADKIQTFQCNHMTDEPVKLVEVCLMVPGISARWKGTPDQIAKLVKFAMECVVEAQVASRAGFKVGQSD